MGTATTIMLANFSLRAKFTISADTLFMALAIVIIVTVLTLFGLDYYRDFQRRRQFRRHLAAIQPR